MAWALQERDAKGPDSSTKDGHSGHGARSGSKDDYIIPILEVHGGSSSRGEGPNGVGIGDEGDPMYSLQAGKQHAVACFDERSVTSPDNRQSCRGNRAQSLNGAGGQAVAFKSTQGMMVRRLTPRECERLQGFPDDWTRWDSEGKEISDSARYRMLGNAVTTYVAEWLGKRIVKFT